MTDQSYQNEPITWEEFRRMPYAAQQIYACSGGDKYYGKQLKRETLFEKVFSKKTSFPPEYIITREKYEEGIQFLVDHGYIAIAQDGTYTADKRCRHLVAVIMPYEHIKAGLRPNF